MSLFNLNEKAHIIITPVKCGHRKVLLQHQRKLSVKIKGVQTKEKGVAKYFVLFTVS